MKQVKRRVWSILLACVMLLTMLPASAWAADEATKVADSGALIEAFAQGGEIQLQEDIALTADEKSYLILKPAVGEKTTLDLNGHTLTVGRMDVQAGSNLTIKDTSTEQNGVLEAVANIAVTVWPQTSDQEKGVLTVEGGTIQYRNQTSGSTILNGGEVYVKGGTVLSESEEGDAIQNSAQPNTFGRKISNQVICELSDGAVIKGTYGVTLFGQGVPQGDMSKIDNERIIFTMNGGTIETTGQGIGTNASSGRYAGATININGGTITSEEAGMYLPAISDVTISGGEITAPQAIRICAGTLNITGGTITGTKAPMDGDLVAGGSGGTQAAIVIGKAGFGYVGDINVNISGDAVVQNTAEVNEDQERPAIVVSDKNMANKDNQNLTETYYDESGKTWGSRTIPDADPYQYSTTKIQVNLDNVTVTGDIIKVSNLTQDKETDDGGNVSLNLNSVTVNGRVINQTTAGALAMTETTVSGDVSVTNSASVSLTNSKVAGKLTKDERATISIKEGGYFNSDPSAYVENTADVTYVVVTSDLPGYQFKVTPQVKIAGTVVTPAVGKTTVVEDSMDTSMTDAEETALTTTAKKVEVPADVLSTAGNALVSEMQTNAEESASTIAEATKALKQEVSVASDATVTIYVQTYLEVTPKSYSKKDQELTVDIQPMYQLIASTASAAKDIVFKGEGGTPNAVTYGTPKKLELNDKDVEVTIQLPTSFMADDTAYVVHTKGDNTQYLYDGQVANNVLTFTNPNGFSDFTVYSEDPAVARVYASDDTEGQTSTGYMTLQEAVNVVGNGGFIVAKKSDSASVSRRISFTVSEENGAVASISAGRGYRMTKVENEGGTITYTFRKRSSSSSNSGSTGGIGTRLPVPDKDGTPSVTGFESDTNADLTVSGRYQFRITSLDSHTPVLTVNNANFTVSLASRSGNDYFYVITCAGTPGSTAAVSVDGKYLLTATVGGSASGVVSDTTHPFTVAQGGTYQFRLTAAARPSFAAGSASFTVEYAGQEGNDYFYKVHAVGQAGDGCGFYINGEAQPVAVATIG